MPPRNPLILRTIVALAMAALGLPASPALAWQRPHAVSSNIGLQDVVTIPAVAPINTPARFGSVAPGAGPVVGPDGTVYVGTIEGRLMAFRPDGTPWWNRDIGQMIVASPVIDSAGSVYVVGVRSFTDHRVSPPVKVQESVLHKFTASGGWIRQAPFPKHFGGAVTNAAPNIWRSGDTEAIMVPIKYYNNFAGNPETHLIAFSTDGQVIADVKVGSPTSKITGGAGLADWQIAFCLVPPFITCLLPSGFSSSARGTPIIQPLPMVAIFTQPGDATPIVVYADGFQDLVGYTFNTGSFVEVFRVHDENTYHVFRSTPMVAYDGHTVIGTANGLRFAGPNMNAPKTIGGINTLASPTQLRNGKTVVVTLGGEAIVLQDGNIERTISVGGYSMASAAASHNHFFVSTETAFVTVDANTLAEVTRINWRDGGLSSPVIGSQGNVYAIAANQLYVFPGPSQTPVVGTASTNPQAPAEAGPPQGGTLPEKSASQSYKPPLTANSHRLFACEELDGDDCGKGDYRTISLAFCQKQGFATAADFDVDSRKGKAETLDGRFCSKNKCKVFDEIVCTN